MILKEKILFNKEECDSIIWSTTKDITNWNQQDRVYNSQPINYSLETKWLFDKLKDFFEFETGLEIKNIKEKIHFHKFVKNNWFGKHNDVRDNRIYAIGVLLNDDFEGGNFTLHNPNEYIINKELGNTYIFDVRIEHEVAPITNGDRYSLLWFLQHEHIKPIINKII